MSIKGEKSAFQAGEGSLGEGDTSGSKQEKRSPSIFLEKGRLVVNHEEEGPYPVLVPCPGLRLIVNGQDCEQMMPITKEDLVRIETVDERREGKW